jgi:N-acetyltransferase 10
MASNINNTTKKKVLDSRIPSLIRNGVESRERSFIILVGDKSRNQIPNLHYLMMNANLKMNKSILWAYKKKLLGFTSNRLNREKKIKKDIKRGTREANDLDPFEAFLSNNQIRYVYYKETEKILGNTYGTLVLQDFEGLTPNLMARTIETVEGGGLVIMLLKSMKSLKQLYTMTMDVHSRYRTEAHNDVVSRFNERFLLSLADNKNCLVVDDQLNVLPISGARHVKRLPPKDDDEIAPKEQELIDLKESLADTQPAGSLVSLAKTVNQAEAILRFIDAIAEKTLNSTVALTAGRGRGKSASLGIAIAAAVAQDYSNIFVTSPSPENLKTLFEFIFRGFDAMGYVEHHDYDIIQSTNPSFNKAIVRVDIKRAGHRQTIQYISPTDNQVLGQAELLIIDEAAAIPLPLVKKLLGPYLVFMASTINGYEGTGRSLSLKLIQQLRDQSKNIIKDNTQTQVISRDDSTSNKDLDSIHVFSRSLIEVALDEPIRYAPGDPVESWLNKLLCLDAKLPKHTKYATRGCPHPSECSLFYINRDTLFSYDPVSEAFLQRMMALFVSSHYKNSPNDLQLMSDAPAHQLYALFGPDVGKDASIPTPLCVLQIALEGEISKDSIRSSLSRGVRAGGDLIPWLVSQQFQDDDFASLSGARVVRIATHPDYTKMGYGSRALELLTDYFEGKFASLEENSNTLSEDKFSINRLTDAELEDSSVSLSDEIKPRKEDKLPPLFVNLAHKSPYYLHYLGVSYGLTQNLHKFWRQSGFTPVYLRQTTNDLTGEHTCVMLKTLENRDDGWLKSFTKDFHKRFINLLSYSFSDFSSVQALSVLESSRVDGARNFIFNKSELDKVLSPFDLKRLESYANNLIDYHVILDLLPYIASQYFNDQIRDEVALSHVQSAILLAIGLQHKELDNISKELNIETNQSLAMFSKIIRKVSQYFRSLVQASIAEEMPELVDNELREMNGEVIETINDVEEMERELEADLEAAGTEALEAIRERKEKQKELINNLNLDKYKITDVSDWKSDKKAIDRAIKNNGTISLKKGTKRKTTETATEIYNTEMKSFAKEKSKSSRGKKSKK